MIRLNKFPESLVNYYPEFFVFCKLPINQNVAIAFIRD